MASWNHDSTILFIEIYHSAECLWKIKSKDYSNKYLKEKAYENLVERCQQFDPSVNKDTIVKKINNIRSSFRRELKKIEQSKMSGAGSDVVYEPKLWYYDHLMFLTDQETPRQSRSNINLDRDLQLQEEGEGTVDCESQSNSSYSHVETEESPSQIAAPLRHLADSQDPVNVNIEQENGSQQQSGTVVESSPGIAGPSTSGQTQASQPKPTAAYVRATSTPSVKAKRGKRNTKDSCDDALLEIARANLLATPSAHVEDEWDVFGKSVAYRMRGLSQMQKVFARKHISDVLFEAELEQLSRERPPNQVNYTYQTFNQNTSAVRQYDSQNRQGSEELYESYTQHHDSPRFHPYS